MIEALLQRIAREGSVPVTDYMQAATAQYYARGAVFGLEGDFITAPEISQTFGELIGLWCAVAWQNMGAPASFQLVECGPGRGTLMKDALRAAARVPGFTAAAQIHLVEQSPALKDKQRAALADHAVTWHDVIATVPAGPTILIANEFLDALPIRQFEMTAHGWLERHVATDASGQLSFILKSGAPASAPTAKPSDIFETSPAIAAFIVDISARISRDGGAALLIDYGHGTISLGDTLQAVKRHKPCGVFETPGEADLTAHVDFAAVRAAAAGVKAWGPVLQGTWLSRLGIKIRGLQLAKSKDAGTSQAIESGIRRLTEANAMGALFKVIALTHPSLATPEGFQQDDAS